MIFDFANILIATARSVIIIVQAADFTFDRLIRPLGATFVEESIAFCNYNTRCSR